MKRNEVPEYLDRDEALRFRCHVAYGDPAALGTGHHGCECQGWTRERRVELDKSLLSKNWLIEDDDGLWTRPNVQFFNEDGTMRKTVLYPSLRQR